MKNKGLTKANGNKTPAALVAKTVKLVLTRDTKPNEAGGAAVYGELDAKGKLIDVKNRDAGGLDAALIGTLYMRKKHLGGTPAQIEVTVKILA